MSRSYRKPASYLCSGAVPSKGKAKTSRQLRHRARILCHLKEEDISPHLQDRNRGNAGTKDPDHGWDYFGDGRRNPYSEHKIDRLCGITRNKQRLSRK